jgi:hypothetical protein
MGRKSHTWAPLSEMVRDTFLFFEMNSLLTVKKSLPRGSAVLVQRIEICIGYQLAPET